MNAYHQLAASYDRLTNDVDYEKIVDFYHAILDREKIRPRTAVDLACGTGSVALLLAREGLSVVGVDLSEEMLTVAFQKAQEAGVFVQYTCQGLQDMKLPRGVDMAVCALDGLDYILLSLVSDFISFGKISSSVVSSVSLPSSISMPIAMDTTLLHAEKVAFHIPFLCEPKYASVRILPFLAIMISCIFNVSSALISSKKSAIMRDDTP